MTLHAIPDALLELLRRDLRATGHASHVAIVDAAALNAAGLDLRAEDVLEKVVGDVQQRMHDEFVDTTWPRCPLHANHPLWYEGGVWRCPSSNAAQAELGQLQAPAV
jgi:hypothetical protein